MARLPGDKPRVVCITTRFSTGGAELDALLLAQAFQARGCDAELWSLYRASDLDHTGIDARVMLDRAPRQPLDLVTIYRNLRGAIAAFRPDVILSFQPLSNILGSLAYRKMGRFVASQRNPSESQRFVIRILEGIAGSTSLYAANIMISQSVSDSYGRYPKAYRDNISIVYNGLPELPQVSESQFDCREKLNLPQGVPLIGNVARLHYQKNQAFLIDLVASLPGVHLMLAGDGPDEAALRNHAAKISDRVHFTGRIQDRDVALCYKALDIFAFPSRYEGFGRSPIEAMAARIPVIANDIPIMREVIGEAGALLPLDIDLWSEQVSATLAGDHVSLDLAQERARSFSLDAMIDGYVGVLFPSVQKEAA